MEFQVRKLKFVRLQDDRLWREGEGSIIERARQYFSTIRKYRALA